MSSGTMVVPMVLWGRHAPTHCISTVLMTPDMKHIVSGCNDGQICIWDVADNWQVGHGQKVHQNNSYFLLLGKTLIESYESE